MTRTAPDDAPTTADIAALTAILAMQADMGAAPPTSEGVLDFITQLHLLETSLLPAASNPALAGDVDLFLSQIASVPTGIGSYNVPALWIAQAWSHHVQTEDWIEVSYVEWAKQQQPPPGPPGWRTTIGSYFASIQPTMTPTPTPGTLIYDVDMDRRDQIPDGGERMIVRFEKSLFTPTGWPGFAQLGAAAPSLWNSQSADIAVLKQSTRLSDSACISLLFLLAGCCTSPNAQHRSTVEQIASLDTDSTEYPNDTLIDQLVYFTLMTWVDPRGGYQWSHTQLVAQVGALLAAVPDSDPGSQLVARTLEQQLAVLNAATSYPMIDPYNPAIPFPTRCTDTLAALNRAWMTHPR